MINDLELCLRWVITWSWLQSHVFLLMFRLWPIRLFSLNDFTMGFLLSLLKDIAIIYRTTSLGHCIVWTVSINCKSWWKLHRILIVCLEFLIIRLRYVLISRIVALYRGFVFIKYWGLLIFNIIIWIIGVLWIHSIELNLLRILTSMVILNNILGFL